LKTVSSFQKTIRHTSLRFKYFNDTHIWCCDMNKKFKNMFIDYKLCQPFTVMKNETETSTPREYNYVVQKIGSPRYSTCMRMSNIYIFSLLVFELVCEEHFFILNHPNVIQLVEKGILTSTISNEVSIYSSFI